VTAAQTSSSISGGVLFAASTGSAFNSAIYDPPSLFPAPRGSAPTFIESRGPHTGTNVLALPAVCRMRWRFVTDAPIFELQIFGLSNSDYSLLVDGAFVASQVAKTNNAATFYDKYDFSAEATPRRRRVIDVYGNGSFTFAGVRVAGTDAVWKAPALPRVVFLGDSFTSGYGNGHIDWSSTAARNLGWMEFKSGAGSTGYLSTNGGASVKFRDRLTADVSAYSPDAVVIAGGINDIPGYASNSWTNADLTAEASLLYAQTLSENPRAAVFVVGPWRGSTSNGGSNSTTAMDTALQTAALAQPEYGSRLFYLPTLNDPTGPWQFGNLSTGNFSVYGSGDGTHPIDTGHLYLGRRFADAVRSAILRV
jgi:lysophospholipase L1-like esterase